MLRLVPALAFWAVDWLGQDPPGSQVLLASNATIIATYNACTSKVILFLHQVKSLAIFQELGAIIEAFLTRHQDIQLRRHLVILRPHHIEKLEVLASRAIRGFVCTQSFVSSKSI